ncbi:MAG: hypothetical protein KDB23_19890, partial [Planctomycetales bacterium]|nr:hypothetical protein [Planctomycetales bacterium]
MQKVRQIQQHIRRYGSRVPSRLLPLIFAAFIAIGGALLWQQQQRPSVSHELLWSGRRFTDSELAAVLKALSKAKLTQFTVVDRQIRVPQGMSSKYLTALADGQALPKDFQANTDEALNSHKWYVLEGERRRQFSHAQAKAMAQVIIAMDGIDDAFVQYDEAESRGLQARRQTTASVAVMTTDGHVLDAVEASTIRQMVAAAKAGMKPEDVSVTDLRSTRSYTGALAVDDGRVRPQQRLMIQQNAERYWQDKIDRVIQTIPRAEAIVTVKLPTDLAADAASIERAVVDSHELMVLVKVPRSYVQISSDPQTPLQAAAAGSTELSSDV